MHKAYGMQRGRGRGGGGLSLTYTALDRHFQFACIGPCSSLLFECSMCRCSLTLGRVRLFLHTFMVPVFNDLPGVLFCFGVFSISLIPAVPSAPVFPSQSSPEHRCTHGRTLTHARCIFLCVVLAASYLNYRRHRLSCLPPFVWHFLFILTRTYTHTHTPLALFCLTNHDVFNS